MPNAYEVTIDAPLFASLNEDYEFATWWKARVVPENRPVIVLGPPADPQGVAVLKGEEGSYDLGDRVLKICTFKVDESQRRLRRGELLLRAIVDYAAERQYPAAYLTAWPKHEQLLGWLTQFGFARVATTDGGEHVMAKRFAPSDRDVPLEPLEHAIAYGPRALLVRRAFVVPIQAEFHARLLPDSEDQFTLLENEDCGNAIRKAYLCRSNNRQLQPGDTLLFLRTEPRTEAVVTAVGVVEDTLASGEADRVAAFVRGRTVYTYSEIRDQCAQGEVLAIRFRLDRRIDPKWTKATLTTNRVMSRSPMSITAVAEEGAVWVRQQLGA